jgi:serine/threonine-protein kinase
MNTPSVAEFVETLESVGLLSADQLSDIRRSVCPAGDTRVIAGRLLKQGWLTAFQANQLLVGRGEALSLGPYVLLERLGTGGMGEVFKARHQRLDRLLALKILRKERLENQTVLRRFHREMQAVAQLNHPNIVVAFDADDLDGKLYLSMELVDGQDLATRMSRCGLMPIDRACEYVRQTALGLQHAHERGLIHRDIKPSNLLVTWKTRSGANGAETREPLVKIVDFGLALLSMPEPSTEASTQLTRQGMFIGTPDFAAPEQALDPHSADARSDLYALGCTFYFLLGGEVPFPGGTPVSKLIRQGTEEPKPLEELQADIPPVLCKMVRRLMAKDPAERYPSARAVADELAVLLNNDAARLASHSRPLRLPSGRELRAAEANRARCARFRGDRGHSLADAPTVAFSPRIRRLPSPNGADRWWLAASLAGIALLGGTLVYAVLQGSPHADASTESVTGARPKASTERVRSYVRRPTRRETILATLQANGLPTLEGPWHIIGPFDSDHNDSGFDKVYPPEKEIRLDRSYGGKKGRQVPWRPFQEFAVGSIVNLRRFEDNDFAVVYLYHALETSEPVELPVGLGSDDTLTVWLNGEKLLAKKIRRGVTPDEDHVTLRCRPGRNELLLKIANHNGEWGVYVMPALTAELEKTFAAALRRDFPEKGRK